MSPYKLSICIPTYNRGAYIGATLESILSQIRDDVEVIVSDNASTDNTEAVVLSYQAKFPLLQFHKFSSNQGADANYLKVVELAQGKFCWLMGSDDAIEPGAIARVIASLARSPGLSGLTVKTQSYDQELLNPIPSTDIGINEDTYYKSAKECFTQLGPWFGYLSAQIVRRDLWMQVVNTYDLSPYYNAYVHVYVIARMLKIDPNWMFLNVPCVSWRSGNDSFLDKGIYNRIRIDVLGYQKITRDVFGIESKIFADVMKSVATIHVRYALVNAKVHNLSFEYLVKLVTLTVSSYWKYPVFWVKVFPIFLFPSCIVNSLRKVRRVFQKVFVSSAAH